MAAELADYFRSADSAFGLSSSWTPLVGIAMGGAVTSTDPESRVVDGRFRLGPARSRVGKYRAIRSALLRLPGGDPSSLSVLWAAHGPVSWARLVVRSFGEEYGAKLGEFLDVRLFGVALLTPEFRAGSEGWEGPQPTCPTDRRSSVAEWDIPSAWLLDLAVVAKSRTKRVSEERRASAIAKLSEVGRSARFLLSAAEELYRRERGDVAEDPPEEREPRRSRRLSGIEQVEFSLGDARR